MEKKEMNIGTKEKIMFALWGILMIASAILFGMGNHIPRHNVVLFSAVILWTAGVIYCVKNKKERIFLFFFLLSQLIFLMIRPIISSFRGQDWWVYWEDSEWFAVRALYISLIGLILGGVIASLIIAKRKNHGISHIGEKIVSYEKKYKKYMTWIAGTFFCLTWGAQMVVGLEKVLFISGKTYLDYYSSFQSHLPYLILVIGSMMKYFLCIYLAVKPSKGKATMALVMYILSTIPALIVGIRNPFVLSCIFAFLYYCIRDIMEDKTKWLGRKEKIMSVVAVPVAVVLLGIYTYTRSGANVAIRKIGKIFIDFFYNQGVSFDVLAIGHGAIPYLPKRPWRNYTFGGIIDYFTHGKIGQLLCGNQPFPDGNCLINALERNSFAHNMSYIACGKEGYLSGNGMGSSYILETYADFGYVGVLLFSIILGFLLVYTTKWMKKNVLVFTIILVSLTTIFFTPRAESTGWIEFLFSVQFWLPVIITFLGAYILGRQKEQKFAKK